MALPSSRGVDGGWGGYWAGRLRRGPGPNVRLRARLRTARSPQRGDAVTTRGRAAAKLVRAAGHPSAQGVFRSGGGGGRRIIAGWRGRFRERREDRILCPRGQGRGDYHARRAPQSRRGHVRDADGGWRRRDLCSMSQANKHHYFDHEQRGQNRPDRNLHCWFHLHLLHPSQTRAMRRIPFVVQFNNVFLDRNSKNARNRIATTTARSGRAPITRALSGTSGVRRGVTVFLWIAA